MMITNTLIGFERDNFYPFSNARIILSDISVQRNWRSMMSNESSSPQTVGDEKRGHPEAADKPFLLMFNKNLLSVCKIK